MGYPLQMVRFDRRPENGRPAMGINDQGTVFFLGLRINVPIAGAQSNHIHSFSRFAGNWVKRAGIDSQLDTGLLGKSQGGLGRGLKFALKPAAGRDCEVDVRIGQIDFHNPGSQGPGPGKFQRGHFYGRIWPGGAGFLWRGKSPAARRKADQPRQGQQN
jgi:hypothetical protein